MSTTQTANKTLEATLAPPTQCKEQRLQQTLSEYRDALHDAFEQDCTTMSTTNDVVTPYNLPYQAKDALKSYVPKLHNTYNAQELDDEHPLRFVNRAGKFDRDSSREYEICWNVPQPGRGTNFWIPLRLNPEAASDGPMTGCGDYSHRRGPPERGGTSASASGCSAGAVLARVTQPHTI
jgi:hypothetical protein